MEITVKKVALWRTEVENKPGVLAQVLGPWLTRERTCKCDGVSLSG